MDLSDVIEKLNDKPELATKLEDAIKSKVKAQEFYGILVEGGVGTEVAEAAMAEYQRRCGLTIADEDVDEEMLRKVAGGGCGTDCSKADDCDSAFKDERLWNADRCILDSMCDEVAGSARYCWSNEF